MPQLDSLLKEEGKKYLLGGDALSLADLVIYHELVQVLSVIAVTNVLFSVDTSTNPVMAVKNVDISSYPKLNAWMYLMSNQYGAETAISRLEQDLQHLRARVIDNK